MSLLFVIFCSAQLTQLSVNYWQTAYCLQESNYLGHSAMDRSGYPHQSLIFDKLCSGSPSTVRFIENPIPKSDSSPQKSCCTSFNPYRTLYGRPFNTRSFSSRCENRPSLEFTWIRILPHEITELTNHVEFFSKWKVFISKANANNQISSDIEYA